MTIRACVPPVETPMPEGYDTHADYMGWIKAEVEARQAAVAAALTEAFARFIEKREVDVINFSVMTAMDLAAAIRTHPTVLKALLACCNVAGHPQTR